VDFVIEEKRDVNETVQLAQSGEEKIRFYAAQPYLSPGAKAFMKELSELMAKKAALQRQINEWTQQAERLGEEQSRLRSNIESLRADLPKEQELRAKWVAALATNEDQLVERRAKLDEAGGNIRQLEESLAKKVREYKDE
jgi:chromosome segregation ATPase